VSAERVITAALGAATLILIVTLADTAVAAAMAGGVLQRLLPALLVNIGGAAVAWMEGVITPSGALTGVVLGTAIYLGGGWEAWMVLAAMIAAALIASSVGGKRKQALGIAQAQEGRRGVPHVLANCGAAAAAAIVAMTSPYQSAAWLALVAALTAAGADTVASEIGKARGGRTWSILGLRPVAPGTPGAVSIEGSIANVVAALGIAALAAALGLVSPSAVPLLVVAAILGALIESVLAATLEPAGILNNHLLNYINAAVAAAIAVYLTRR
jgi:uncharacterized protein (TIGR00297 family)